MSLVGSIQASKMAKLRTRFQCQACGATSPKWTGQCADCGAWNSLVEEAEPARAAVQAAVIGKEAPSVSEAVFLNGTRVHVGISPLDEILGGGVVPGSLVLVGGDPGIGKSTLLTQAAGTLAKAGKRVLYLSGEESAGQVRLRAERLHAVHDEFKLVCCAELSEALGYLEGTQPEIAIVDSIQTLQSSDLGSAAGGVAQIRHCASVLQQYAKSSGVAIFLVGHVTKEGSLAGPKILEHLVDTVLYFEGDGFGRLRTLRAAKNRFGSVDEIAVFEMTENGLEEVENPSAAMLAERQSEAAGSVVFPIIEGSRSLLVEIQALVAPNYNSNPRRTVTGLDYNRVLQILGVMEKRCGYRLGGHDIFVSVVGGLTIREPAVDLAVFLAIASSFKEIALPSDIVVFGEIGLTGDIRSVAGAEIRLKEAARQGFARAATSSNLKKSSADFGIKVGAFRNVQDLETLLQK